MISGFLFPVFGARIGLQSWEMEGEHNARGSNVRSMRLRKSENKEGDILRDGVELEKSITAATHSDLVTKIHNHHRT